MFDALLLASFLTGPAFRAMTNGLPSSTAAAAGSTAFLGVIFGFRVNENAGFRAGAAGATAATVGGTAAALETSSAGTAAGKAATELTLEASVAATVSVVESGFSLISYHER